MDEFIDGATYQIVSKNRFNGLSVVYSAESGMFQSDIFSIKSDAITHRHSPNAVKLMAMGPAPAMSTPPPFANIDNVLKLLGLTAYNGDLSSHINQIYWHLVDNYCIAEDADFDKHMGSYRNGCTDEQALRKAVKRIRRQNKQCEELHETRRQLEQRVKVLNEQVKELNEKYVEPVKITEITYEDPYPELHEDSEFIPTPVGLKSHTNLPSREPIKSDGLSSSYYSLMINGNSVETEDVIRDVFGNDFDFGNVFKCLVRMYGAKQGAGKAGASIEYDGNKIHYSINKITGKGNDRDNSGSIS